MNFLQLLNISCEQCSRAHLFLIPPFTSRSENSVAYLAHKESDRILLTYWSFVLINTIYALTETIITVNCLPLKNYQAFWNRYLTLFWKVIYLQTFTLVFSKLSPTILEYVCCFSYWDQNFKFFCGVLNCSHSNLYASYCANILSLAIINNTFNLSSLLSCSYYIK
jgi:hypothetical protein